jgi:hypothetical protein
MTDAQGITVFGQTLCLSLARFERGHDGVRANWPNRASARDS